MIFKWLIKASLKNAVIFFLILIVTFLLILALVF